MSKLAAWFIAVAIGVSALTSCGNSEASIRSTLEVAAQAVETSLNTGSSAGYREYFATPAEGAIESGLKETREALDQFAKQLTSGDRVQFHTFQIQNVALHESAGQATATYRLHFSVVRNGAARFSAVVIQNIAVIKTPRGWRIAGGGTPDCVCQHPRCQINGRDHRINRPIWNILAGAYTDLKDVWTAHLCPQLLSPY